MAVWCLFSFIGAWMTLRHTPFYTLKSTLKTLGLTLLMVCAAAAVIALTDRLVHNRSLAVQTTALASVVTLCTLGLILGISTVSTPAGTQLTHRLPPNVPVVTLYRARLLPWVRRAAMALGVTLVLMGVPGALRYIAGSCAVILAFFASIMLPTAYIMARRVDRAITALQLSPWLHWKYPPEAWNAWCGHLVNVEAKAQAVKMSPAARRLTIFLAAFAMLYAALVVPASTSVRLGCAAIAGLFVFGISLFTRSGSRRATQRLAQRLEAAPCDTYFGRDGVFCNGEFCAWSAADVWLLSAAVEPAPPRHIELWFERILPGGYGGARVLKVRKDVLIAADAAVTDLTALQAALVARCPQAKINLA